MPKLKVMLSGLCSALWQKASSVISWWAAVQSSPSPSQFLFGGALAVSLFCLFTTGLFSAADWLASDFPLVGALATGLCLLALVLELVIKGWVTRRES